MAEFVEASLEELVPVFEQLGATELFSQRQIGILVKRCRRWDYRIQKSHKNPDDFIGYAEYLADMIHMIAERRRAIGYTHKKQLIEFAIKKKAASLYRRLCERFQGKLDYWLQYINFTSTHTMKAQTSKAFIQAMQMHPRSLELRIKAARWEWEENKSVDNARRGLQMALRLHPESVHLWATLFEIELDFVSKIKKRRQILLEQKKGTNQDEEESIVEPATPEATDAVLALRIAEIVMEQAFETIGALKGEEAEGKMGELLVMLWRACLSLDASDADASRVRTTLEERMAAQPDETVKWRIAIEKRLAEGEELLEVLSSKDWSTAAIDEIRWAMRRLKETAAKEGDGIVFLSKARELLSVLVSRSSSSCSEEEAEEWARGVEEVEGEEQKEVVTRAVQRFPRRALFWRLLLESEGKGLQGGVQEVIKHTENINKAIEKAGDDEDSEEAVKLYQLAIDTAIQHFPTTVEKVFKWILNHSIPRRIAPSKEASEQVFRSSIDSSTGATHRALKQVRVDYLLSVVETGKEEAERANRWTEVERKMKELVQRRPNSVDFYVHVGESLLRLAAKMPMSMGVSIDALVDETLAAAVAEHPDSDDAWIARCELLMERAPLKVVDVYRRAILSLKDQAAASFISRYTILQQAAASKYF